MVNTPLNDSVRPSISFRPLEQGDASLLHAACWPECLAIEVDLVVMSLLQLADAGRAWGVVATVDRRVVGFGRLNRLGHIAEISDLVIAPDARGHGVGTALISHLIERARKLGIKRVEIGAAAHNGRALALYQRLGFDECRREWLDLGDGPEEVIYLSRDLCGDATS